jgi:hypothetical protein
MRSSWGRGTASLGVPAGGLPVPADTAKPRQRRRVAGTPAADARTSSLLTIYPLP